MKGEIAAFVDTNVLVYAVSTDDPRKQERASSIVERGFVEGCYAVSTQVLMELYVNITQMRISPWDAAILEAARKAGCGLVLSEDLGAGQSYAGVRVENPF
jgi:predicted nucleic acid-binding protein